MKVLVAHITAECNEHISRLANIKDFNILYGEECIDAMHIRDVFENKKIEIIPAIFAGLHPSGMIEFDAYNFIVEKIIKTVKDNLKELDGIYLQLHGASGIYNFEEVSGEHYLIRRLREVVGMFMPIAVVLDPHGNITKRFIEKTNIARCYRQSPHSDQVATEIIVAEKFTDLLINKRNITPIILKLPILVGGERSVSAYEPMKTINKMLDEAEKSDKVLSASYHVGYIRHDDDKLGAAVVVVPNNQKDSEYCKKVAKEIAEYAWEHRKEFKFNGNYDEPEESVKSALNYGEKTVVITDSGDNCGAGGAGQNTEILKIFLKQNTNGKKVLIAGIQDRKSYSYLECLDEGSHVSFDLGVNEDYLSSPIHIEGQLIKKGDEMIGLGSSICTGKSLGTVSTVRIDNTSIDVMVLNRNVQYGNMDQFHRAGLEFHDYDIVVVKMGYLDTYLIPETKYHIMALTDGPTIQRSERIPFKKICRPMWPIDDMEELVYIEQ